MKKVSILIICAVMFCANAFPQTTLIPLGERILEDGDAVYGYQTLENSGYTMLSSIKINDPNDGTPRTNIIMQKGHILVALTTGDTRNKYLTVHRLTFNIMKFSDRDAVGAYLIQSGYKLISSKILPFKNPSRPDVKMRELRKRFAKGKFHVELKMLEDKNIDNALIIEFTY